MLSISGQVAAKFLHPANNRGKNVAVGVTHVLEFTRKRTYSFVCVQELLRGYGMGEERWPAPTEGCLQSIRSLIRTG